MRDEPAGRATIDYFGVNLEKGESRHGDVQRSRLPCVDTASGVLSVDMLHRRLAAAILVVALFGANTATASICEARCTDAAETNADHHHQTSTQFSSPQGHAHGQHSSASCSECLKSTAGWRVHSRDCEKLAEAQALQENARASSVGRGVLRLGAPWSSAGSLRRSIESKRYLALHSPPPADSEPVRVSLRI